MERDLVIMPVEMFILPDILLFHFVDLSYDEGFSGLILSERLSRVANIVNTK